MKTKIATLEASLTHKLEDVFAQLDFLVSFAKFHATQIADYTVFVKMVVTALALLDGEVNNAPLQSLFQTKKTIYVPTIVLPMESVALVCVFASQDLVEKIVRFTTRALELMSLVQEEEFAKRMELVHAIQNILEVIVAFQPQSLLVPQTVMDMEFATMALAFVPLDMEVLFVTKKCHVLTIALSEESVAMAFVSVLRATLAPTVLRKLPLMPQIA